MNEFLLIASVFFIFGMALAAYRLFGKAGLYCISVIAMILANIEALIMVRAFGIEQTLGNVLFAVTFLITDILSGKVDFSIATAATVLPHVEAGKLRALAVPSARRTALLPQVPTVAEAGLPGFE